MKRILLSVFLIVIILISAVLIGIFLKQDAIVQSQVASLNKTHLGQISVGDVHLAPFSYFPYISLKVDDVSIHPTKHTTNEAIIDVADIYLGFNFWDILSGNYDIKSLTIEDGTFNIVRYPDGKTNLENALSTGTTAEKSEEKIDIHLKKIELKNLDIHQREEATNLDIETFIYSAKGGFKTGNDLIDAHIDTEFELNVMSNGDTTYLKNKHFELHTDLTFNEKTGMLTFKPSGITMEHGDFELEGNIDTKNEMNLDLALKGTKPNFDMFIAFAPVELIPVLERYENAGKIYFNAAVKGPTTLGRQPFIDADFGASEAYLENADVKKRIDEMGFTGHFTNGLERNLSTIEFSLTNITANLETGKFIGSVVVENFEEPQIEMQLDADFNLDFIVGFLNLTEIKDAKGTVAMRLNFNDIIDLDNPEKALNELNQAYFAELNIKDLSFNSEDLPAPLADLDVHLEMNGKKADLDKFNLKMGQSNLAISGFLSDLPAIVHHTPTPVSAHLEITSKVLDIAELTHFSPTDSTGTDERIENLSLAFSFNALGNAFTEFKHLPKGEFFIDNLYADLKHYPHTLHDFHADVLVKDDDLKIVDFTGFIDQSDFHFNGLIHDYSFWMQDQLNGDVDVDITLKADMLKFENLFTYQGQNYVPKDYQHEQIKGLEFNINSSMHYTSSELKSVDFRIENLEGKMLLHSLKFEEFSGRFHLENEHLNVEKFHGKMGLTIFDINMNYYLGKDDAIRKKDNAFSLKSDFIDFDALSNYNLDPPQTNAQSDTTASKADVTEHAEAFNIYEVPFTDMQFNVDVKHFIYHRLDLKNTFAQMRTTKDHYLHIDTLSMDAAGGHIDMSGYFNGSDPKHIYLKPNLQLENVDLDKLLFKFENFGQDAIVSDNLHGKLNAVITGNIRVYPDMVPDLDQSEIHMDVKILNGSLENYSPIMMLSDYFGDKNLESIKFDTLQNHMDITNGKITVPNMTIESSIGHMDISGTQDMNDTIDYYVRIPWTVVKQAARNKLLGTNDNKKSEEDDIVEIDPNKKTKYLNVNISGTFDEYKIKMKKAKK